MNIIGQNSNMKLHFVPMDYCAKAILALANNPHSYGKCFNLYGNDLNISILYQALIDRLPHLINNKTSGKNLY
jgi:hypothetical protein